MRKNTRALRFTALLLPFVLMACDDPVGVAVQDDPDPVGEVIGPVDVSPQLDAPRRTAAVVGAAGGSVSATSVDGTIYRLTVQAETLGNETEIVATPVAAIPDLPPNLSLLAAVDFSPDGLELFPAASLDITLPAGTDPASVVALGYTGDGKNLQPTFAIQVGGAIRVSVPHFSGVALVEVNPDGSIPGRFYVPTVWTVLTPGSGDIASFAAIASDLYDISMGVWLHIVDAPGESLTLDQAIDMLGNYGAWKELVFQESPFDPRDLLEFPPLVDALVEGDRVTADVIRRLIADMNRICTTREILSDADRVLDFQKIAEWIGVDQAEHLLDLATVIHDLCVHVSFAEVTFPQQPLEGEEETLRVVVGHDYGGETFFTEAVQVTVIAVKGVTISDPVVDALADGDGIVDATAVPTGGNIEIQIGACLTSDRFPRLSRVCQDAFVLRGLLILPTTPTIAPGESQRFSAAMLGVVLTENVVWTAEGGSITQEGFFVAGNELGTFTITASSIDDPTIIGTARVTISGEPAIDQIVFRRRSGRSSGDDHTGEIYAMSSDGSDPVRLTDDDIKDVWPALSPDGRRIAFTSAPDGTEHIYVMDADGSNLRRLSGALRSLFPRWSPDGMTITYTIQDLDAGEVIVDVFAMDADGSNPRNLTSGPGADAFASWSPDGSKIAFTSNRDGDWEIYVMNADGSDPRRLTNSPLLDQFTSWSPDGRKIAFSSFRDRNWEIYVMDADGSNQVNLTNDPGSDDFPSWSPDGTKIAFESRRDGNPEIYVMDADGSNLRRLTNNDVVDEQPFWGLSRAAPSGAR